MLEAKKIKNSLLGFILKNRRNVFVFSICAFLLLAISNVAWAADAATDSIWKSVGNGISEGVGFAVALVIGFIALLVTSAMGLLSTMLIKVLISIAQYNNFIGASPVVAGWVILRDICNMFFILILLVIAFATILRMENYSVKKMLPKLLIMAVLINFSKTIFGLIIDAGQVVMMTFVNAFSQGAGFFVNMLLSSKLLSNVSLSAVVSTTNGYSNWIVAVSLILAVIASIITVIVLAVMIAILIARIVMLWIYIILSPLVFLGFAFPPLQKYTGQIWQDFIKQVVVGPVLAFFIWLALTTQQTDSTAVTSLTSSNVCAGVGEFFCDANFQKFLITIGLLFGGLMVAQQAGGAAAGIAGKGLNWAKGAAKLSYKAPAFGYDWFGRKVKMGSLGKTLAGLEIRPTKIYQGVKDALIDQKRRDEGFASGVSSDALRKGGVGGLIKGLGASRDLMESISGPGGFLWRKGIKQTIHGTVLGGPEASEKLMRNIKEKRDNIGITYEEAAAKKIEYETKIKNAPQEEKGKLLDEFRNWNDKQGRNIVTQDERKKRLEEIDAMEEKLILKKPIQTYYADRERDALISEARQKLGNNDNEEDLVDKFNDALVKGNREVAQAVMIHAARVGHLNEIIQSQKSKKDVYEDVLDAAGRKIGDKLVIKKGDFLPQGGEGLNELTNQFLIGKLGIDRQSALSAQSEASSLAKATRHFNLAESVGSKNGFLVQRSSLEQRARARGELRKVPAASVVRDYNRLSWGNEHQYIDENGKTQRQFQINELGIDNFMEMADSINAGMRESRWNKNAAMNVASDIGTLEAWVDGLESRGVDHFMAANAKGEMEPMKYRDLVKKIYQYGSNVKVSGDVKDYGDLKAEVLKNRHGKT